MNAAINTLEFADAFEQAGFDHEKARALVTAFAKAQETGREDLVTKAHLDLKLAELKLELMKAIADNGKDISNRLWSTVTIIAGVATAISATIGAAVALILKWGGL